MGIRGKVIVIFEHDGKYLFTVCYERDKDEVFYIPVGGGIEFGEHSMETARREVKEETGQEIVNERLLSITENIFTYNGVNEHEIIFTYYAEFKDKAAYSSELKGGINDQDEEIKLIWASLDEIISKGIRVYPSSLLELLKDNGFQ